MKLIIRPRPPESGLFRYRISSGYLFTRIRVDGTLNHRERFHKSGFNEQILWFRVAVPCSCNQLPMVIHFLLSASFLLL